jgi:hypothetical protein
LAIEVCFAPLPRNAVVASERFGLLQHLAALSSSTVLVLASVGSGLKKSDHFDLL